MAFVLLSRKRYFRVTGPNDGSAYSARSRYTAPRRGSEGASGSPGVIFCVMTSFRGHGSSFPARGFSGAFPFAVTGGAGDFGGLSFGGSTPICSITSIVSSQSILCSRSLTNAVWPRESVVYETSRLSSGASLVAGIMVSSRVTVESSEVEL